MSGQPEVFVRTISEISESGPELILGNLFGKPCAKLANSKPFLSFHQDCMVYKLGADRCQALMDAYPDCGPFDPSGKNRPFKDWIQVPEGAGPSWLVLGQEAVRLQSPGKN